MLFRSIYMMQSESILSSMLARRIDESDLTEHWLAEVSRCGESLKRVLCGMIDDIWKNEEYAKLVVDKCYGQHDSAEIEIEFKGRSRKIQKQKAMQDKPVNSNSIRYHNYRLHKWHRQVYRPQYHK